MRPRLARPPCPRSGRSPAWALAGVCLLAAALLGAALQGSLQSGSYQAWARTPGRGRSQPAPYASDEVVVRYRFGTPPTAYAAAASASSAQASEVLESHTRVLRLRPGVSVASALARLRKRPDVAWAGPDYLAHISQATPPASSPAPFVPDDPGEGTTPGGWEQLQWNFVGTYGVNAPQAWGNVAADHAPGGEGVTIAVLDTGVAYANHGAFKRSPDFESWQFVKGYDFIEHGPYPNDHNGHGTFVAGTIAEATNNGYGLTGLAYEARIMPVRVLDANGEGEASTIAEGIRYAVRHGAQIINLSLEFSPEVNGSDVPELISALDYANRHNVLVVAAAGNEGSTTIPYPARARNVISVGATTEDGCLANYSNYGSGITLVAPGGGPNAELPGDPNCHQEGPAPRDIFQETFTGTSPSVFGFPNGYEGTSMATPHVTATAALIIAARILGPHPTPAQLTARLVDTARKLGDPADQSDYGAGLLDAAAATAQGGPGAIASTNAPSVKAPAKRSHKHKRHKRKRRKRA